MVSFYLIRHGESKDNLKSIWAGSRDAPLTNHGMNQAKALASSLSHIAFASIHSSPLQRTMGTAEALQSMQTIPVPQIIPSKLLQERAFGDAEGQPYTSKFTKGKTHEWHYEQGIYPSLKSRNARFPGNTSESVNDVRARAKRVVDELLLPYVWDTARNNQEEVIHVAITSHGIFLTELVAELLNRGGKSSMVPVPFLRNTGWHRIDVNIEGKRTGQLISLDEGEQPKLVVQAIARGQDEHLKGLVRQKGGVGSIAHDRKQQDIRGFFGK
ncbi:phosphoglycerate mutase-like protein [Flagelloscypha sp. PMI_526]|nr:phosphoglycerate mutase-like protein [Flagelloscypha sp. PMI_526]